MSIFLVKSILAVAFLAAGAVAVLAMLSLMGVSEHKTSPQVLRKLHRAMGFIFVILLIVTSLLCAKHVARVGDQISHRAALHGVFALALIAVLAVKIAIVKWFKGLLHLVPAMGIVVFVLAFVVAGTSAGYFFVRGAASGAAGGVVAEGDVDEVAAEAAESAEGDVESGRLVFEAECSSCHAADNDESGFAPGLKGLFKKESLPHSGRPATVENVISQLREPVGMMPSFNSLSGQDLGDLVEYLKTL
jgi:mono/diheme cytochrome c family protein